MRKIISHFLVVLFLAFPIFAQSEKQKIEPFDEFDQISLEEIMARLDNLIFTASQNPNTKALVRIYGGSKNCFLCHYKRGSLIDAYLKNTRKFSTDKYLIEWCNEKDEERRTQLFVLPINAERPKCDDSLEIPKYSVLFDILPFYDQRNNLLPLENSYIEIGVSANGEYSLAALKKVKEILDKSPESKIYVIAYLGTNLEDGFYDEKKGYIDKKIRRLDKQSTANKLITNARNELIKNGIKFSQIKTVNGGYVDDRRKLEFWFVPNGGEIPKPKPDYFPKKKRAVKN